jgi:hypothetical protein
MSFAELKKIADQTPVVQVRTRSTRNVPLRVDSYDLKRQTVKGIDLHTGDEMTIRLRPDPKAAERSAPRAEITDFAGKGPHGTDTPVHTQVGGVILFDYVHPDPVEPGLLGARWGRPYSNYDGQCDVFVTYAAPFVSSTGRFAMDVVRTLAAAPVTTVDELRSRIDEALYSQFAGAVIRATDGVDTVMYTGGFADRVERFKIVGGKMTTISSDEAINNFLATPFGQVLAGSLGDSDTALYQDFVVEVLPVERIYATREAQQQIGTRENLERWHQMGAGVGYTQTILAVRHEANGSFLTGRPTPVDTLPELYQMKNVPTANIAPRVAPYVSAQRDNAAAPANELISDELASAIGGTLLLDESLPSATIARPR